MSFDNTAIEGTDHHQIVTGPAFGLDDLIAGTGTIGGFEAVKIATLGGATAVGASDCLKVSCIHGRLSPLLIQFVLLCSRNDQ